MHFITSLICHSDFTITIPASLNIKLLKTACDLFVVVFILRLYLTSGGQSNVFCILKSLEIILCMFMSTICYGVRFFSSRLGISSSSLMK